MVQSAGQLSKRAGAEVSVMSVSLDVEGEQEAKTSVDEAVKLLRSYEVEPRKFFTTVGNPVEEIITTGSDYSFIVLSDTGRSGLQRFFMGSVAFKVMEFAKNSVMVVR